MEDSQLWAVALTTAATVAPILWIFGKRLSKRIARRVESLRLFANRKGMTLRLRWREKRTHPEEAS